MRQITIKVAHALHAAGYMGEYNIQHDLFGGWIFAGPLCDVPLPSWLDAAAWLEHSLGIIITRVFPERYKYGQWVAVRILFKGDGSYITLPRVSADLEQATQTAIEWLISNDVIKAKQ